jgi:hypothetical protein
MSDIAASLFYSALGAGLPVVVWEIGRLIIRKRGKAKTIPERMDRVELILLQHGEELAVQTEVGQATLEALRDNKCNGNVTTALQKIAKMKDKRDKFYREHAIAAVQEE